MTNHRFKPSPDCPEPLLSLLQTMDLHGIYVDGSVPRELVCLDLVPAFFTKGFFNRFVERLIANFYSIEGYRASQKGIALHRNYNDEFKLVIPSRFVEVVE